MKIAVIGKGKTGSEVIDMLDESQITGIYSNSVRPTMSDLRQAEIAIVFVPGEAITSLIPILLAARIPVICGATNVTWPENFLEQVKSNEVVWVNSHNFSLSIYLIHKCLKQLSIAPKILNPSITIHEVHHVDKKDAPSGTALTWKKWLGLDCDITSQRREDENGIHTLKLETLSETITLTHTAHSRKLFAEGAIWTAKQVLGGSFEPGVYDFIDLIEKKLADEQ
jgi:4-hydroxy-tetrahydrodipicolinate reductase